MANPVSTIRMPVLVILALFSLTVQARALQEEKTAEEQAITVPVKLAADLHESVTTINVVVKDMFGRESKGDVVITQFKPDGDVLSPSSS